MKQSLLQDKYPIFSAEIPKSESRYQTIAELMAHFGIDEIQAEAILELKLRHLAKLEEMESDIFQHIHLENNILFPRLLELKK